MPRITLSDIAEEDLVDIWDYISDDNISAADAMIDLFEETFERLVNNPEIGIARS